MTYVISQPCVDVMDRACVEECPVDCIYEGRRSLYIHPDECVDCGACRIAHPAMLEAVRADGGVKLRFLDWPIFGDDSRAAARFAASAISRLPSH